MLESKLQTYFIKKVKDSGGLAFKVNCDGQRGFPDLVIILDGMIRLVEVKSETGRLSGHQKRLHAELSDQSINVSVIASQKEMDDFIRDFHYDPY